MSTPEFFQRGPTPLVRLVFFSAVSVALMVVDARYHSVTLIRSALTLVVYPAQQLALLPVRLADGASVFFSTQRQLQRDNDALRRRVAESAARANQSTSLEQELAELRELSHLPPRPQQSSVLTEVIHGGRNPYIAKLVLDSGSNAGLQPGQPVIDAQGVVGQITSASPLSAEVTLVTEENQQIPVRVLRNGLRTLAGGDGASGTISLPFLPGGADIQTGDTLVTSGIDGLYPEGIPVATVSRIERSANRVFARITCTPLGGVAHDRYLLVLLGTPPAPVIPGSPISGAPPSIGNTATPAAPDMAPAVGGPAPAASGAAGVMPDSGTHKP